VGIGPTIFFRVSRAAFAVPGWLAGLAGLGALLLAGCADIPINRQVALPDLPKETESLPSQREHQRILASYGGTYDDPRLEAVLNAVVERLVAASERPDLRYRVVILNSPAVNAFALPSGQLYVSRGLLSLANDNSELASVLAHEMAHVLARHAEIRENQARQAALISRVATDIFNDPEMSALTVAKSKIALAGFSRAQEFEADGIGVGISARAGFDPYGGARFLTAMSRNASLRHSGNAAVDPRFLDFLSSHPSTPDRVRNAQANARQFSAPGAGDRDRIAYLNAIDNLPYGEDPSEGYVRGRRFLHPKLGFTFLAPANFLLENTAQAVLGVKEGGGQALRLDVVRVPAHQSLGDYLQSGWIENIDPRSVEELTIGGLPAASALARGDQWTFRLYAVRLGNEVYRFVFAAKSHGMENDRIFRASVESFRRMTAAEVESARPLRIKVVTVAPGDTADRLSSRMATDRPLERFLVLNGLERGQALRPGDRAKIVVE
jgi:predicted Zn-dependent protease